MKCQKPGKLSWRGCAVRFDRAHLLNDRLVGAARRSLAFELLEERAMLSIAQDLVNQLTLYQSNLNTALDAAVSLPLVGDQLADLPDFDTIFQNSLASINAQTQGIVNNGHFQISVALPTLAKSFAFDLGLDAFLQVTAAGNVQAAIAPTLNVAFNYNNGTTTLDVSNTRIDLGFNLSLPGFVATASLNGLLFTRATDQGSNFQGNLGFKLNPGGVTPEFSGEAHVLMGLTLSFVDPALNASFNPTFRTTLDLDWGFGASNQLAAPSIQFLNFGLDADGFLDGFLGDIVTTVQKFTKPIQPFVDIFQTPVPIVSAFDSSETIGTLLLKGAGSSQSQQESFTTMIQIINAVNAIDLSGGTGGAVISFGNISLTGDARLADGFNFDTGQISGIIDDIFNSPALQEVQDALETVADYAGLTSSAGFKFPLLENPGPVIGAILTGQTETMFSFSTGRQHFELAPTIGVGIPGVLGIFLEAGIVFDANLTMGYDTAGLIAFAADPSNPAHLLHGFYFDNSIDTSVPPSPNTPPIRKTGLYLSGLMELQADVLLAHATGGLYADVNVELVNTDASSHVHLDTMLANLGSGGKVFDLSGKIYASADVSLELSLPIGPDITLFSFNLAYEELLNFDPPPPPSPSPPPVIHDVVNQRTLLLDVAKMPTDSQVRVEPFHNLIVSNGGSPFEADGIRVDYANEVHLFVERKNNVNTNHYNLIGLNGTTPDGVSINVIDPFRVFVDEGAPNPYIGPTKPGVLLTGGKDVIYRYNEAADGTKPIVLLAGGFGSNTLTGGTMMFGNFIPAPRIAQAKSHFANTAGYDGAGLGLINSRIDAALAPASPAGVIGAKITGSRGGLMFGGAGSNSFIATGAGVYEMIGGNWVNSFDISPSFNGAAATYQVDGGGGDSRLVVRVPADEHVIFENSTFVDKYTPTLKALAVQANAGLSATAHGIQKVHIIAAAGSRVVIGDTSEVDIDFSIAGGAHLVFGGTNAPDEFQVSTSGNYYDQKNHFTVTKYARLADGSLLVPGGALVLPNRFPDPVYSITRTFGTNGKTQTIPFVIGDAFASSIELDAAGASDTYEVNVGVGAFIDVTVNDSDTSTRNELTVNTRDSTLIHNKALVTDNALHLDYYTKVIFHDALTVGPPGPWNYFGYASSVHYQNAVFFSANVDLTFGMAVPYIETTVNRSSGPQRATILVDGQSYESFIPFRSFGPINLVFDVSTSPYTEIDYTVYNTSPRSVIVAANAGELAIEQRSWALPLSIQVVTNNGELTFDSEQIWTSYQTTYDVAANTGTLNINSQITGTVNGSGLVNGVSHIVNVRGNQGTINLQNDAGPTLLLAGVNMQVNVGNAGSLTNIHGAINLASFRAAYGLKIDDRNGSGALRPWSIDFTEAAIGDLALGYAVAGSFVSDFQAFTKVGSPVTIYSRPLFFMAKLNGADFPSWGLFGTPEETNFIGDTASITTSFFGSPGGTLTYSALNLPAGLSINPTTGLISGTIAANAFLQSPYETSVLASNGTTTVGRKIDWQVRYGITIDIPTPPIAVEGVPITFGPITTTNRFGWPVTLSASDLPPGLTFNPATRLVTGTIPVGTAQHGPYVVTIHAADGIGSESAQFTWSVTGITMTAPTIVANYVGDIVNRPIGATTANGLPVVFSAENLPDGLSINPSTGVITGTVASPFNPSWRKVTIRATQGSDTLTKNFFWNLFSVGQYDGVSLEDPGNQLSHEGDSVFVSLGYASPMITPVVVYTVTGLPAGLSLSYDETFDNIGYIVGSVAAGAASGSPYTVHVSVTDGFTTDQTRLPWIIEPIELPGDFDGSGIVNQGDYDVWRSHFGQSVSPFTLGDGNGDGKVDSADYTLWRDHLGQTSGGGGSGDETLQLTFAALDSAVAESVPIPILDASPSQFDRPNERVWRRAVLREEVGTDLVLALRQHGHLRAQQRDDDRPDSDDKDSATEEAFAAFDEAELLCPI